MGAAGALALFGAVYGSLKALTQSSVPGLLAYVGLGFYSTLWVALAAGQIPAGNRLAIDTASVALLTAGLLSGPTAEIGPSTACTDWRAPCRAWPWSWPCW